VTNAVIAAEAGDTHWYHPAWNGSQGAGEQPMDTNARWHGLTNGLPWQRLLLSFSRGVWRNL